MELALAAMSAGGLVGAANQYLCLLLIAVAAQQRWIELAPEMAFMRSGWFIVIVSLFWIATAAPAYSALLAPGIMNTVNTLTNFLSGFVVPISSGIIALASAGVIVNLDPESQQLLETIRIFGTGGGFSGASLMVAGGGAAAATSLTVAKAVTKPAISLVTGTSGTLSAPMYATLENIAALILMGLLFILINVNPWLLVALFVVVAIITIALMIYGLYLLWKLGKGIGRLIRLIEAQPKAGWAVVAEFFMWGSGWLIWNRTKRGTIMITIWAVYGLLWWVFFGISSLLPFLLLLYFPLSLMIFFFIGLSSARALLRTFDIPDELAGLLGGVPMVSPS